MLRAMLIYELSQVVPTTLENIQFGLYCLAAPERKRVEGHLKALVKSGAIFFRQQSKTYELAAGSGEDPYDLIDRFLADESLYPKDIIEALLTEAGDPHELEFLKASQYNLAFNEDKRFSRRFVRAKDLGKKLWSDIHQEWEQNLFKEKQSSEGTLIYALCENETDVQLAKNAVKDIPYENMAVAVPHAPQPFLDVLLRVKACRYYLPPNEAVKISAQTESRLRDIFENAEDGYRIQLQRILQKIMSGEEACWYGKGDKAIVDKPASSHRPADHLCEQLYKKRCRINHPDLNVCHDDKWRTGKNNALKQAVKVLLEAERVMIDNGNPDNHGEKRYLEKVLLKGAGALRKTGSEGTLTYFECEDNPDKISDNYPILKILCQELGNLSPDKMLSLREFFINARNAPYGTGAAAQILALTHAVRAFGERLRFFSDTTKTAEIHIDSYDDVTRIAADPGTKVVVEVIRITDAQRLLVDAVAKAVHAPPLKYGEIRSVEGTAAFLQTWWRGIPEAAKILDLYKKEKQSSLNKLKELLDHIDPIDRFDLLLSRLPSLYSGDPAGKNISQKEAQKIGIAFSEDAKLLDTGLSLLQQSVVQALCPIFGVKGDLVECEAAIDEWYKGLNPNQRNPSKYDESDAFTLLSHLAEPNDKKTLLFKILPQAYKLNPVPDWTTVQTEDYAAKIKQAKAVIDEAKPDVPVPEIKAKTYEIEAGESLVVSVPRGAKQIIYTMTSEDPKKSEDALRVTDQIDLAYCVKDKANVIVKMRSLDEQGNASDIVTVEVVNKAKKYEVAVDSDLFGGKKASFKFPDNLQGFKSVLKSLVQQGVARGLVSSAAGEKLERAIQELLAEQSDS